MDMDKNEDTGEGGGGGWVYLLSLEATGFLMQESGPDNTALVDDRDGSNNLRRLSMIWTVQHSYLEGVCFYFNLFNNWVRLILLRTGLPPTIPHIQEGLIQWEPLYMVLYVITLTPIV